MYILFHAFITPRQLASVKYRHSNRIHVLKFLSKIITLEAFT